ncbi:MAG: hypothetical protein HEQ20_19580 [Aphanizomenon flos-aquae KM1D3_PB]|nr:MAG: hypothetical protein HEQ20_19580 [Aphanizomenon flos-aquae KM1D3_PB]
MLIFQESGRLGNQLFQYAALKSLSQSDEKLILLGFSDLESTFDGIEAKIINSNNPRLERSIYYRIYHQLNIFSNRRILVRIGESYQENKHQITQRQGIFNSIKFVEQSYFQDQSLFSPKNIKTLTFKSSLLFSVNSLLEVISPSNTNIFVHIRRSDYLSWPSKNSPAVLPASYYRKCINIIRSQVANPFFIFTSDDPFYVKDIFSDLNNSYISRGSSIEDFTLMSHCSGGILSASSFSWWSAYFAKSYNSNGIFLAPKFWAGHSVKSWFPQTIESDFLTFVDVY